jgi:hypothetical protein
MMPTDHRTPPGLRPSQRVSISPEMPSSFDWEPVEAHWATLMPKAAAYWSRLPAEEMKLLPGDRASLVRLVRKFYGVELVGAEAQVDAWLAGLSPEGLRGEPEVPLARTKEEQRAEGEGMGAVPGASSAPPE